MYVATSPITSHAACFMARQDVTSGVGKKSITDMESEVGSWAVIRAEVPVSKMLGERVMQD